MNKNEIRKSIITIRNNISNDYVEFASNKIISKLKNIIDNSSNIMIFMDMKNEVKISKLLSIYEDEIKIGTKTFFVPKTFSNGTMKINKYNKDEMILHPFGYLESSSNIFYNPNIIDLIIVPGIAFDNNNNRIGFGKGFYDRFLNNITNTNILTIGVCYKFQIIPSVPTESHDYIVDMVISD